MQLAPGDRVDSYEIVGVLGAGGMGSVYRARDPRLGRDIAIKLLQDRLLTSRDHLTRFIQEARSASALNHPNIVTIYDIGETQSTPYIAMELVEGERLRDLLKDGPLSMRRLLQIATQIADGLAAAHERGIVHRDLKPENLMITGDNLVKIVDFGLARLRDEPARDDVSTSELIAQPTREGAVIGTAAYMSPEQASGKPVDFRSDQFSLGSILYEMASGKRPFSRGSALDTLSAIVHDDPEPVEQLNPKVPLPLRWTIQRCLAKDPRDRYASTRDLARDLQTIRDHLTETTTGETVRGIALPFRHRRFLFAAAGVVLILTALGIGLLSRLDRNGIPTAAAQQLPPKMILAVLPFEDLSGTPNGALFGRGFAETVSNQLSKSADIQVIPPSAIARLVSQSENLTPITQAWGANLFLQASTQQAGGNLRVNYSIVDPSGRMFRGDTVTGTLSEIFQLQDDVADSVISDLGLKRLETGKRGPELTSAEDQQLYVEALAHLQRYEDESEVNEATRKLEDLARRASNSALAHAALGRAYLAQYKLTNESAWTTKAASESERARNIDPTLPEVHLTLGDIHLMTGKFSQAIEHFRRALTYQPNSADAMVGLAEALDQDGQSAEAEKAFQRGIELRPSWWSGYNKLGAFYFRRGDYQKAREMFRQVVRIHPANVRGYANLGGSEFILGDIDAALASFAKSIQAGGDSATHANLGYCYYYLGRYQDATASFRRAIAGVPNYSLYWGNLGDAQRALGQHAEAQASYRKAIEFATAEIKVNPKNARSHGTLAHCYAKTGKHELAHHHMEIALALQPEDPNEMVQAAMVANLSGKESEAVAWLQRAFAAGYARRLAEREPDFLNLWKKNLLGPAC